MEGTWKGRTSSERRHSPSKLDVAKGVVKRNEAKKGEEKGIL